MDVLVPRVTVMESSQFQGIVHLARLICCLHWPLLDETSGRGFQMKDHAKLAPAGARADFSLKAQGRSRGFIVILVRVLKRDRADIKRGFIRLTFRHSSPMVPVSPRKGWESSGCPAYKAGCLCSPSLVLGDGRIPGELLFVTLVPKKSDLTPTSANSVNEVLREQGQVGIKQKLPSSVSLYTGCHQKV